MPRTKPTNCCFSKSNLTLSSVLLLAILGAVHAEVRSRSDGEMERPSSRAAPAFVPRLGKRLISDVGNQRLDLLGRLVCSSSPDCNQLALLGALVSGLAVQDGELNLALEAGGVVGAPPFQPVSSFDRSNEDGLKLMRLLQRDQLLRRETRTTSESGQDGLAAAIPSPMNQVGAKRVAFTPRIGRR